MARSTGTGASGVFVRTSSGLVRAVSTGDTLIYCLVQLAVHFVLFNVAYYVFYPGASMEFATLLALATSTSVGITYALFSSAYPRSGGEYVFLSRTTHPIIGFVCSFMTTFWQIAFFGINGAFCAFFGVAPLFHALGLQTRSQALSNLGVFFDSPMGRFVVGFMIVLFFTWQLIRGMRLYFSMQKWAIMASMTGFLIFILVLVLGTTGTFDFQSNFDRFAGQGAYSQVIDKADKAGTKLNPPTTVIGTANFSIWPAQALLFTVLSVSFSGEIKNRARGQLIGIVGANLIGGTLVLLVSIFARASIGDVFLRAAGYLGNTTDQFPLPSSWLSMLASLMANNVFLTIIINLTVIALSTYVAASTSVYASRVLLAWGIDGVAPKKLGEVSERYHTPVTAILVTALGALIILAIFSFTDLLAALSGMAAFVSVFVVVCVAGIIFPYTHRDTYETSPAKIEISGLPLMTLTGFVGLVTAGWIAWRAYIDDFFRANTPESRIFFIVLIVSGVVWYFVIRRIRMKEGIDMDARFKEIPIE